MFDYSKFDADKYAEILNSCILRAKEFSNKFDDTGTMNLDTLILTHVPKAQGAKLIDMGLPVSVVEKTKGVKLLEIQKNQLWLDIQNGQASRNTNFVRKLGEFLREAGIMSSVKYIVD